MQPFVVMSRNVPLCSWPDAYVLDRREQHKYRSPVLSRAIRGFHSGDSKASFLVWLSRSNVSHAWHVEDDAYLHRSHPNVLSSMYADSSADIVAMNWSRQVNGWVERRCNVCTRDNVWKFGWPIVRISRRLAHEVLDRVRQGARGHHEVLIGTICRETTWCRGDIRNTHPFVGHVEPVGGNSRQKKYLTLRRERLDTGKVYHPVDCKRL